MQIGRPSVMITDNGTHSPATWAEMSASQIGDLIKIDEKSNSEAALEARRAKARLLPKIEDALLGHHEAVLSHERTALDSHGVQRYAHSLDIGQHVPGTLDEAIDAVVEVAAGSPFEAHFRRPETQEFLRRMLTEHFASAIDVERSQHADDNGTQEMYQAARHASGKVSDKVSA